MTVTTTPVPSRVLPAGCSFAGANPPGVRSRSFGWRARWAAIGAAIAVVAGTGGVAFSGATNAQITPSQTLITPCRIMDTRSGTPNVGPRSTPLAGGETYSIQVTGTNGNCTIPPGTSGVVMNVTIVGPGSNGFLTVFPGGATRPTASNLNYVTGQAPTPNQVTVALGSTGQVSFFASGGPVNVIADIAGYTTAARLTNPQLAQNRWDQDLARPATVALSVGALPSSAAFDGTNIWVSQNATDSLTRINPATNLVVGSPIPTDLGPRALVFDGTNMWTVTSLNTLQRFNATTGASVGAPISVGGVGPLAFDGTNIWAANTNGGTIARFDAATGAAVGSPITVGTSPQGLAFDGTTMWVANLVTDNVIRVAAATGTVIGTPITVGDAPRGVAFDGTSIWVANSNSDTVTRIDAATGTVIGTPITVGDGPFGITFDGADVWVTNELADTVTIIDAASGTVVGTPVAVGDAPRSLAFDGTSMWVSNRGSSTVTKLRAG